MADFCEACYENLAYDLERITSEFDKRTVFQILGIERDELKHSRMVAWFLSPDSEHGLNTAPLKYFIKALVDDKQLDEDFELTKIKIELEKQITKDSRLDIFISANIKTSFQEDEIPFYCIIENKVKSSKQNNNQTERYSKWLDENVKEIGTSIICLKLYLVIRSNEEGIASSFKQINYQFLLDNVFEKVFSQTKSEQAKYLINDYFHTLSLNSKKGEYPIMAMNEETKIKLLNFWEKHQNELQTIINALAEVPNTDEHELLVNNAKIVNNSRVKYCVALEDEQGKVVASVNGKPKAHFGFYVALLLLKSFENDNLSEDTKKKLFDKLTTYKMQNPYRSNLERPLLSKKENIQDNAKNDYLIKDEFALVFNGGIYYPCRLFEGNEFDTNSITGKFVKFVSENFSNIKITREQPLN